MTDSDEIRKEINSIQKRIEDIGKNISPLSRRQNELKLKIDELKDKLRLTKMEPRCSDHAVIRYLERIHGFCFEDIRNKLLNESNIAAINIGVSKIHHDDITLIIKDKCIVTIIDK